MSLLPAGALLLLALGGMGTADFAPVRTFRAFDRRAAPGLPQSTVIALHQNDRGVPWIGTLDGIATFDGTAIRSLRGVENAPGAGPVYGFAPRAAGGFSWKLRPSLPSRGGSRASTPISRPRWPLSSGRRISRCTKPNAAAETAWCPPRCPPRTRDPLRDRPA